MKNSLLRRRSKSIRLRGAWAKAILTSASAVEKTEPPLTTGGQPPILRLRFSRLHAAWSDPELAIGHLRPTGCRRRFCFLSPHGAGFLRSHRRSHFARERFAKFRQIHHNA